MTTLRIPFGTPVPFAVDCLNWPLQWPERPLVRGRLSWTDEGLSVSWHVEGPDLRAENAADGLRQWEDSCCECFLEVPDGRYCNIEVNCAGFLLAELGSCRGDRVPIAPERLAAIRRETSVPQRAPYTLSGDFSWDLSLFIPWAFLGYDRAPERLRANFYKCGDATAHPHFLSWAPIDTPSPDFHRPEFFGTLLLLR